MATRRPLLAGNWKMNGLGGSIGDLHRLHEGVIAGGHAERADILICPPATLIASFAREVQGGPILIGGQDCHAKPAGAYTGDISAPMLADAGAKAVILGHSERRFYHGERDGDVRDKADAAYAAGLLAIICVGETRGERRLGLTLAVISRQLEGSLPRSADAGNTVIAYEPVWAIGTGLTPTVADVIQVHRAIRGEVARLRGRAVAEAIRIVYGGSVNPNNATELLGIEGVDGGLIGGASLKADDFLAIVAAGARRRS